MINRIIIIVIALTAIFANLNAGWEQQHLGMNILYDIDFPPGEINTGFACGALACLLKTTDGGTNWTRMTPVLYADLYAINFPVNATTGYIVNSGGFLFKTEDGGDNWQIFNEPIHPLYGIHFPGTNDTGYAVGALGEVIRTTDGVIWFEVNIAGGYNLNLNDVYFIDGSEGWVVADSGKIFHTTNGGQEWTEQPSRISATLYGVFFRDANHGWVVGANKTCLKTTDGGQTWDSLAISLPANTQFNSVTFPVDLDTGFIVGSFGRVAKTTDGGNSWTTTSLLYNFYRVEFPLDNLTGWVCGQNEAIYKTTDGGGINWIEETNSGSKPTKGIPASIPNPFRQKTVIRSPYPVNSGSLVRVFDRAGNLVRILVMDRQGITNWDGRDEQNHRVTSGVYLLEFKNNRDVSQRVKLVLLD